jgi:hypothetical protein
MIPWYSITYSDGLEHVFISYKLLTVAFVGIVVVGYLIAELVRRLSK